MISIGNPWQIMAFSMRRHEQIQVILAACMRRAQRTAWTRHGECTENAQQSFTKGVACLSRLGLLFPLAGMAWSMRTRLHDSGTPTSHKQYSTMTGWIGFCFYVFLEC